MADLVKFGINHYDVYTFGAKLYCFSKISHRIDQYHWYSPGNKDVRTIIMQNKNILFKIIHSSLFIYILGSGSD